MPRKICAIGLLVLGMGLHSISGAAEIKEPPPGSPIGPGCVTFEWEGGIGSVYYLGCATYEYVVRSSPWSLDFCPGDVGEATEWEVCPPNPDQKEPIFVRLWESKDGGNTWPEEDYKDYEFTVGSSSFPELITPDPSHCVLPNKEDGAAEFEWTAGIDLFEYGLGVGCSSAALTKPPWGDIAYVQFVGTSTDVNAFCEHYRAKCGYENEEAFVRLWGRTDYWYFNDYECKVVCPGIVE